MTYSISLIDIAGEKCGSFYALSKRIDLAQSTITEIRKGKRPLPVDVVPELAELAGVHVDEAIHQVLMERAAGTKREGVLREILGKALVTGAAATLLSSYSANANSEPASTPKSETGLTKSALYCRFLSTFRAGSRLFRWAGNRLRSEVYSPQAGPQTAV